MSSAYYLINDQIHFYFEQTPKKLHFNDNKIQLTPKEAQTLLFALQNSDRTITADEIATCLWGEQALNNDYQNKKSQAITHISKIRKRFEKLGYKEKWLQTEENQGYRLLCSVHLHRPQPAKEPEKPVPSQKQKMRLTVFKYTSLSTLASLALVILLYWLSQHEQAIFSTVAPLPPLHGVASEPRFSPDGEALVFSHESNENQAEITLKLANDVNYIKLTEGYFDQSPVFSPSGAQLAFHRTNAGQCTIEVMPVNQQYEKVNSEKTVARCSATTSYSSIAWLDEKTLLFTDKRAKTEPLQVFKLDLSSEEVSDYLSLQQPDYFGAGLYYLYFDSLQHQLYVLDGEGWGTTRIFRQGSDGQLELIKSIQDTLRSIAVYEGKLLFKDLDNQMKMFSPQSPEVLEVVYPNPLFPIFYPTLNQPQRKVAFVSGEYYQSSIIRYDLNTHEQSEYWSSDYRLGLPLTAKGELLVVSRESGINQIYSYRGTGNEHHQLSNFKINRKINAMAASEDKNWLAVTFHDGTTLYRRGRKGLHQVKHFPWMIYPDFAPTNQRLLLTDTSSEASHQYRLVEYDLSQYEHNRSVLPSGVVINDGKFGVYRDKEIVYTPSDNQGIYLFSVGGTRVVNESLYPINPSMFTIDGQYLYMGIRGRKFVALNIDSSEVKSLPDHLFAPMTISDDAIYYVSEKMGNMSVLEGVIANP